MQKKYLFILLIVLFPIKVNALSLQCPDVVAVDEEFDVQIDDSEYVGIMGHYASSDVFSYINGELRNNWKGYYFGNKGISASNIFEYQELNGLLKFKVNSDVANGTYHLLYDNVEAVTNEYQNVIVGSLSCDIVVASNDNSLKSLEIDGKESIDKFDNDFIYAFDTYNDSITINATANDNAASVSGDLGKKQLNIGANVLVINVVSVRGIERNYKLLITRKIEEVKKDDDKKPNNGGNNNTGNVDNYTDNGNSYNDYPIIKSSDISLKSLIVGGKKIDLEDNKFIYDIDVANDVTYVNVEVEANNSSSSVVVENIDELKVGDNYIYVIVTAEDGTVAKYMINVKRGKKLSNDNKIKSIIIKGYDLAFSPDVYDYVLDVNGASKLDIEVILSDENAKYEIKGNSNLRDGSIIKIVVTAENGDKCNYTIKIQSDISHSILDYVNIYYLLAFIGLIFIILAVKIIKDKVNKE